MTPNSSSFASTYPVLELQVCNTILKNSISEVETGHPKGQLPDLDLPASRSAVKWLWVSQSLVLSYKYKGTNQESFLSARVEISIGQPTPNSQSEGSGANGTLPKYLSPQHSLHMGWTKTTGGGWEGGLKD